MNEKEQSRFAKHCDWPALGDECLLWHGAKTITGYGQFWFGGRLCLAHRVVYEHEVGPILEGLQVDHICRNHSCVNPRHLRVLTQRENILIGNGATAVNARKVTCLKGHAFEHVVRGGQRWRFCRVCTQESHRKYEARNREKRNRVGRERRAALSR